MLTPVRTPYFLKISRNLIPFSEVRASSLPVRLLPFSMVPGMTTYSRNFVKAVSLVKKQHVESTVSSTIPDATTASVSKPKGKKKHSVGTSIFFFLNSFFHLTISQNLCQRFLAPPTWKLWPVLAISWPTPLCQIFPRKTLKAMTNIRTPCAIK